MGRRLARVEVRVAVLGPLRLESYRYGPGWDDGIADHAHAEIQLAYSRSGHGFYRLSRRWREAPAGRVHLLPAWHAHATGKPGPVSGAWRPSSESADASLVYHVAFLEPRRAAALLGLEPDRLEGRMRPLLDDDVAPDAVGAFERMLAARAADDPLAIEDAVVALVARLWESSPRGGVARREASQALAMERRLLAVVEEALPPPTLEELGRLTGLPPVAARRLFQSRYGMPPWRHLTMLRLALARSLLLRGVPPAEAAQAAGFVDQSHLTRRMRRYFGHTPAALSLEA